MRNRPVDHPHQTSKLLRFVWTKMNEKRRLSSDWWSVVIATSIVLLIKFGVLSNIP